MQGPAVLINQKPPFGLLDGVYDGTLHAACQSYRYSTSRLENHENGRRRLAGGACDDEDQRAQIIAQSIDIRLTARKK